MKLIQSPFMSDKFAVYVKLTAPEGKGDDLVAAFSELYPGPLDAEPGTEIHVIHQAVDNPDVVFFYELYTDKAAHDAHGQGAALKAVLPKLGGLVAGPPEVVQATPRHAKGITL
jgi:quinol monooxygenase YgiN